MAWCLVRRNHKATNVTPPTVVRLIAQAPTQPSVTESSPVSGKVYNSSQSMEHSQYFGSLISSSSGRIKILDEIRSKYSFVMPELSKDQWPCQNGPLSSGSLRSPLQAFRSFPVGHRSLPAQLGSGSPCPCRLPDRPNLPKHRPDTTGEHDQTNLCCLAMTFLLTRLVFVLRYLSISRVSHYRGRAPTSPSPISVPS